VIDLVMQAMSIRVLMLNLYVQMRSRNVYVEKVLLTDMSKCRTSCLSIEDSIATRTTEVIDASLAKIAEQSFFNVSFRLFKNQGTLLQ